MCNSSLAATFSVKNKNNVAIADSFQPSVQSRVTLIHTPTCTDASMHSRANAYIRGINERNIKAGTWVTPMHTHERDCIKAVIRGPCRKNGPVTYLHARQPARIFENAEKVGRTLAQTKLKAIGSPCAVSCVSPSALFVYDSASSPRLNLCIATARGGSARSKGGNGATRLGPSGSSKHIITH